MEQSTYKPNQYIFNGNSIILDKYDDVNTRRFDQTFEDAVIDPSNTVVKSQYQSQNYEMSQSLYTSQPQNTNNFKGSQSINFNQQTYPHNFGNSTMNQNTFKEEETKEFREDRPEKFNLVPQELIEALRKEFNKQKGYIPNQPEILYKTFQEYRQRAKRTKINNPQIRELLEYKDVDVYYSLQKFFEDYKKYIQAEVNKVNNKARPKSKAKPRPQSEINKEVLNRLYPKQKQIEEKQKNKMNCYDFNGFFITLLNAFYEKNKVYSNNYDELMNFWKEYSEKEQQEKGIQWENGEKDLETEMTIFLSDQTLIEKLQNMYKKMSGLYTTSAKPLIDYWDQQISDEDKYYLGLYKYDKKGLYTLLKRNEKTCQEEKQRKEEKELEEQKRIEKENEEKKKKTKEEYEELQKKFDKLAKPKDKWKTGRVMLGLKQLFKYDNIINKMVKNEFMDNRTFKFPEEYAIYNEDDARKNLFRSGLEKQVPKLNDQKVYDQMEDKPMKYLEETYENDLINYKKMNDEKSKINKEDFELRKYLREQAIKYYKLMINRLASGKIELISKFLNRMYQEMLTKHPNATKRKFKKIGYGTLKKAAKFKKMHIYYPNSLKYYFFSLVRRIGVTENGKLEIAPLENLPFWGPAMSTNCKVHTNGCPVDCIHNTHNDMLMKQRSCNYKQIFVPNQFRKLRKDERFNFWKRPELIKEKEKIFMNLGDAKNCTFEPKITKLDKDEDEIKALKKEDLIKRRIHNRQWVEKMGPEFKYRFPLVYKEGICKYVKCMFADGRYDKALNELQKAFDTDKIIEFFDSQNGISPKPKAQQQQQPVNKEENKVNDPKNEPKNESEVENEKDNKENKNIPQNNNPSAYIKQDEKIKPNVEPDNFSNPKNREICYEVYLMLKEIEKYKKNKKQSAKKLQKELNMIDHLKHLEKNKLVETKEIIVNPEMSDKNHQYNFTKNKYFTNKKTKMCEFGNQCPSLYGNSINNQPCPYAHYKSELKFQQEVNERIKLRKNLKNNLEKAEDPVMKYEWNPVGPIVSCIGCSSLFEEKNIERSGPKRIAGGKNNGPTAKGLCEYCRYHKRADIQYAKDKKAAKEANEKILKRREEKNKANLQKKQK